MMVERERVETERREEQDYSAQRMEPRHVISEPLEGPEAVDQLQASRSDSIRRGEELHAPSSLAGEVVGRGDGPITSENTRRDYEADSQLFSAADVDDLRGRWGNVQASFVDEPRRAVQEADKLVATAADRLVSGFARQRSVLEQQWDRGEDVSTEDLRLTLQRYRTFFDRLLNA